MKRQRRRTYTPKQVAQALEWSEKSIRRHLVHIDDWRSRGGWKSGAVPFIPFGTMYWIPAWWLDRMLADVDGDDVPAFERAS